MSGNAHGRDEAALAALDELLASLQAAPRGAAPGSRAASGRPGIAAREDPLAGDALEAAVRDIVSEYKPYDGLPAFGEGAAAYDRLAFNNPYDGKPGLGVQAHAWDRGLEAAARFRRLREQFAAMPRIPVLSHFLDAEPASTSAENAQVLRSVITCPTCGHAQAETMPTDACRISYECTGCGATLRPKPGDCCVFCSYGSVPCPPIQAERAGDSGAASCCAE